MLSLLRPPEPGERLFALQQLLCEERLQEQDLVGGVVVVVGGGGRILEMELWLLFSAFSTVSCGSLTSSTAADRRGKRWRVFRLSAQFSLLVGVTCCQVLPENLVQVTTRHPEERTRVRRCVSHSSFIHPGKWMNI